MAKRLGDKLQMPDVPALDFVGALAEIWLQINSVAYHLSYVRVYTQSDALRIKAEELREESQPTPVYAQADVVICRCHVAAFFWQLEHVFESLKTAITRGQKEHPELQYFWKYEKQLNEIENLAIRREINDYRNTSHQQPGIIGCAWDDEGRFRHHFLPTIEGHSPKEEIDLCAQLQQYFEFAANIWLGFAPGYLKEEFPRDFKFPVTVPYLFRGDLPPGVGKTPQLEVTLEPKNPVPSHAESPNQVP